MTQMASNIRSTLAQITGAKPLPEPMLICQSDPNELQ